MSLSPLLHLFGVSGGVFLLAFAVLALRPGLSAARRLLVWQAAFAVVLACSPLAFFEAQLSVPILPAPSVASARATEMRAAPVAESSAAAPTQAGTAVVPEAAATAKSSAAKFDWVFAGWLLWAFGVAVVSLRLVVGYIILTGVRRRARLVGVCDESGSLSAKTERGIPVFASGEIGVPMAVGVFSSAVLVPETFLADEGSRLRAILLHESGHARRSDALFLLLAGAVSAIHWFNPLAWLASTRLRIEAERAADDDAVRGVASSTDYAEGLLAATRLLQSGDGRLFPASRMAGSSEIGSRLSRVLDESVDRSAPRSTTRRLALAGAVALALVVAVVRPVSAETSASSAGKDATAGGKPVFVRCVDEQGNPVAEVEVYLFEKPGDPMMYRGDSGRPMVAHKALKTDAKGEASLQLHAKDGEPVFVKILARLPGKLVGGTSSNSFPKDAPFEVKLLPSGTISGRVSIGGGGDLSKVEVRLLRWIMINTQHSFSAYPSLEPEELPAFMVTRPDAEGRFALTDLPASASAAVAGFGPGLGLTQALSMPGHATPLEITLEKEAIIEGTITDAGTGIPAAGTRITARPDPSKSSSRGDLIPYEAIADARGRFRIGSLREGGYSITLNWTGTWTMQQVDVDVRNGETKAVSLERVKGTIVSGLVSEKSGKPIAGAMISAVSGNTSGEGLDSAMTKEDGRFSLLLPPGDSLLYVASLPPRGYAYPKDQGRRVVSVHDGKVTGSTDFSLATDNSEPVKAAKATGRIVDAQGRPLANVLVSARFESLSSSNRMISGPVGSSGADGTFKVNLYANGKYIVVAGGVSQSCAEKKFETGSGTEHALGDFVVRPADATAEGIVVDENGNPVADAQVTPSSEHKHAWSANRTSTDASGKFTLPHLLDDEPFSLFVYALGFQPTGVKDLSPGTKDIRIVLKKKIIK